MMGLLLLGVISGIAFSIELSSLYVDAVPLLQMSEYISHGIAKVARRDLEAYSHMLQAYSTVLPQHRTD
jgi:hypothetical protein